MLWLTLLSAVFCYSQFDLAELKVEYQQTPIGIDVEKPRFSWIMTAPKGDRGYSQDAYRIRVKNESDQLVWDSSKVENPVSLNITYDGMPLKPATKYIWELSVWNSKGEKSTSFSWFETGFLNPTISAWKGAQWIGGSEDDLVFYSHYLSVFKLKYTLKLDKESGSTRASFVFGANDIRLMNKNLNILGVESEEDESYIALELDISSISPSGSGTAKFNVYRVGYSKDDKNEKPFKSFNIPLSKINEKNKYEEHQFFVTSIFGLVEIYLNGENKENKISLIKNTNNKTNFKADELNLNPIGPGNNFISYPMVSDIGFLVPKKQKAFYSSVKVLNYRNPSNALFHENLHLESDYSGVFLDDVEDGKSGISIQDGNYVLEGKEKGTLIITNPSKNSTPMLRTTFRMENKSIKKARLYISSRGIYEAYLNGDRIGDSYFSPGLTQYNKTQMYQTYDVTNVLEKNKENVFGVWLGEGWWSGNITYRGENWNYFGDRQSMLCKLVITYDDGSKQTMNSDPEHWQYYNDGPILYGSFFQGEVYDANRESAISGWTTSNYNTNNWKEAVEVPLEHTVYDGLAYDQLRIIGQLGENPSIVKTLYAKSVDEVRPDVFVYDMGQNMVGAPEISILDGKKGDTIIMRYAEVKYPDLPEYQDQVGMIMLENIRAALSRDIYILKGGDEVIHPRFTFHGYRFVEITGAGALKLENVRGKVISSIDTLTAHYETSNPKVNKLWENISWSFRGNFLSIPTDTPARNERMAWGGDINVFSRTATYLGDVQPFLKKHLLAMRDIQKENGRFTDVAPVGGGFGGTIWGSAGIIVPWEMYQQYGDLTVLETHYPAMLDYVDFLSTKVDPYTGILNEGPLGDWLSPERNKNDPSLLWTAYQIRDLEIVKETAELLGKSRDVQKYGKLYRERMTYFNETYIDKDTHKTIHSGFRNNKKSNKKNQKGSLVDTQASYAVSLAFNIVNNEHKMAAVKHLVEAVKRENVDDKGIKRPEYSLMTGFIGTAFLNEVLSEYEYDGIAYKILQQTSYPSWLFSVVNGATTIWERLDSYKVEEGFGGNNRMNSFNHFAFGAVGAWMINYSLGIQPEDPGFKTFVLRPEPDPNKVMTWAKGFYDSVYGKIKSKWCITDEGVVYNFEVPPNTSATLYLRGDDHKKVRESGKKVKKAEGVKYLSKSEGHLIFQLSSGVYEFIVKQ